MAVPEPEGAVVFSGGNYGGGVWNRWGQEVVGNTIIRRVRR